MSWREIDRIRKQPQAFRDLAARLLAAHGDELNEWETEFLEGKARVKVDEFSVRQAETLLQIRDDAEPVTIWRGFSITTLLRQCFEARADLSEVDEEWIVGLRDRDTASVKRRHIGRLARCASQLGFIENQDAA